MRVLSGRTAFVTGAASGIGLALTRALLDEGMTVAAADRDATALERATEGLGGPDRLLTLPLDVTDRAAMASARDATLAAFGAVDLLCNNAGVGGGAPIHQADFEDWDWMLGINVGGVINGIVTFLPALRERPEAHILNTASLAGLYNCGDPAFGIYTVGKIAVRTLSESLRWALRDEGIGVTALCPGFVRTGIARTGRLHPAVLSGRREPDVRTEVMMEGAMAAVGMDPADVARIAIDAIRRDHLYAITHPEFAPAAAEYAAILADAFSEAGGGSNEDAVRPLTAIREAERSHGGPGQRRAVIAASSSRIAESRRTRPCTAF